MDETPTTDSLYSRAFALSLFTIGYNAVEGIVSIVLGYSDETLALFGFGADSLVEVLSGAGIAVMILRIRSNGRAEAGTFEPAALAITGTAFYLLAAGLAAGIVVNLVTGHKPVTTLWGIVLSVISLAVMVWLLRAKLRVGRALDSEPVLADAGCTRVCIWMSVVLLASSLIYEVTGFAYADVIGAAGLIWFSVSEGREAFESYREVNR